MVTKNSVNVCGMNVRGYVQTVALKASLAQDILDLFPDGETETDWLCQKADELLDKHGCDCQGRTLATVLTFKAPARKDKQPALARG